MDITPFKQLPDDMQSRLAKLSRWQDLPSGLYIQSEDNSGALWLALWIVGAISVAGLFVCLHGFSLPGIAVAIIVGPGFLYVAIALLELARRAKSRLRPFMLISPVEIICGDYDHGMLIRRRLDEASGFRLYTSKSKLHYEFIFEGDQVDIVPPNPAAASSLDAVLELARRLKNDESAKSQARAQYGFLPEPGSSMSRPYRRASTYAPWNDPNRPFTRPTSDLWQGVAAIYFAIALIIFLQALRRR
jgi:hypothetical protein